MINVFYFHDEEFYKGNSTTMPYDEITDSIGFHTMYQALKYECRDCSPVTGYMKPFILHKHMQPQHGHPKLHGG